MVRPDPSAPKPGPSDLDGVAIPFVAHLGFVLESAQSGQSALYFSPGPEHLNSFGVAHGGVLMTLLDVSMAFAARSVQTDMGAVTIEMKTSFMQAACGPLRARGQLLHRTATLVFAQATVHNADEQMCAHATGTFKFVRALAVPRIPLPARANARLKGKNSV